MKTLILMEENDYKSYSQFIKESNEYEVCTNYKINIRSLILRVARKNYTVYKSFFAEWKNKVSTYSKVIIFDSAYDNKIIKYIKSENSKCKIILWLWNSIEKSQLKMINEKYVDDIYTFDLNDSEKYKIKYNSQFYFNNIQYESKINNDILFLGLNKGRKDKLLDLKRTFDNLNVRNKIILIENSKDKIPYDKYLEYVFNSKCLLEIIKNDESKGITLRTMEALFLKKKLITNNKDIRFCDFYNKNNIFILGIDDINSLPKFIKSKYENVEEKIISYYNFSEWLNRFEG